MLFTFFAFFTLLVIPHCIRNCFSQLNCSFSLCHLRSTPSSLHLHLIFFIFIFTIIFFHFTEWLINLILPSYVVMYDTTCNNNLYLCFKWCNHIFFIRIIVAHRTLLPTLGIN
ncbi:hypothetical protein GIB67_011887 [Kingdonia uniflora]|uniref:Uncharacterized protein n=1 Tax=Kingdonia uniflora TaxID=39325 RepID=A0A7J7KVT0_9MAGN|nr:hypothetical protein GIB67_011887 [Kingdonia uniflora]